MGAYFTVAELSEHLGVKASWVYDHAMELPGRVRLSGSDQPGRRGGLLRFRRAAIEAWLRRLEAGVDAVDIADVMFGAADVLSGAHVLRRVGQLVQDDGGPDAGARDVPTAVRLVHTVDGVPVRVQKKTLKAR